jgi:hypothetical protein
LITSRCRQRPLKSFLARRREIPSAGSPSASPTAVPRMTPLNLSIRLSFSTISRLCWMWPTANVTSGIKVFVAKQKKLEPRLVHKFVRAFSGSVSYISPRTKNTLKPICRNMHVIAQLPKSLQGSISSLLAMQ